jgi:hypothetical protein
MLSIQNPSKSADNVPIIGKGATIYDFRSKFAYEVLDVSSTLDEVILKRYLPTRIDEESPISENQTYEFHRLALNHIVIKKIDGLWKMENRHTKRWEYVRIVFGIREEFCGVLIFY